MSSPFPQLLRRANLATYDPLITRIYTSTPSSKSQHSDWGLKFGINLPKGPRYIKFSSLDAGPGINCDWRSGEREARFIQAWGNGAVRWQTEDDIPKFLTKSVGIFGSISERDLVEETDESKQDREWMRDVESMSEQEFETYLERIRNERKRFLAERLESVPESTRQTLLLPEDKTLVHLASTGKTTSAATANFQASLTASDLVDPHSTRIHSRPHRVHGLSYARQPTSTNDFNPALEKRGRALNKISRQDEAHIRSRSPNVWMRSGNNNLPYVIGLGGLTAKTNTDKKRVSDAVTIADEIDYTRADTERGTGNFKIDRAQVNSAPSVLALKQVNRVGGRWRPSSTVPSPLDTFKFDIDVSLASSSEHGQAQAQPAPGSREWVARDVKVDRLAQIARDLKADVGAPKSQRRRGETLIKLAREESGNTMDRLNRLLRKVRETKEAEEAKE